MKYQINEHNDRSSNVIKYLYCQHVIRACIYMNPLIVLNLWFSIKYTLIERNLNKFVSS